MPIPKQNRIQSFQKKSLVLLVIGVTIGYTISYLLTQKIPSHTTKEVADRNKTLMAIYFPIKKGSVWEYAGIKKEHIDGKIETSEIHKRVEVNDIVPDSGIDTLSVTNDYKTEKWIVKDNTINFEPNESQDKFILTFPLYVGQTWGDKDTLKNRNDGYYVWEVEQKLSQEVLGKTYNECFRIAYKTLPDTTYKIFCYSIGIVEEGYTHNGSILEETYKLTAFYNQQANQAEEATSIKHDLFPWLDLPVDYFSDGDVRWGSAGNWETEKGIKQYTGVALNNKVVYQSYPTTNTTIKNYSSEIKLLKRKVFSDVMQEFSKSEPQGFGKTLVEESYQNYGSLATNYLPADYIWTLEKFDVDNDGIAETIVSYNFVGSADAGSYRSDIIKGNNIIFSVQEDNAGIVPADTPNGFYVEWRNDTTARCCADGYMRTRFVFKDRKFVPMYEQQVAYVKVGKETE